MKIVWTWRFVRILAVVAAFIGFGIFFAVTGMWWLLALEIVIALITLFLIGLGNSPLV